MSDIKERLDKVRALIQEPDGVYQPSATPSLVIGILQVRGL